MHAKTSVIDGLYSRVGSTNLNVTGLMTNWEIDVIVQDPQFGAQMEAMFLTDLADASELTLDGRTVGGGLPRDRLRALARGSGPQAPTTVASLGGALVQGAVSDVLARHERNVYLGIGAVAIGVSALIAWLPRAFAWTVAALGVALGVTQAARAFRRHD